MKRKIKFRAWLKNRKRMFKVIQLNMENVFDCYYSYYKLNDIELMQYTGLKDKNGVEIYEGDIVKCEDSPYSLKIGVAEFNDTDLGSCGCCFNEFFSAGFVIKTGKTKNDDRKYFSMYDLEKCEVIGNIYANKELLNENN